MNTTTKKTATITRADTGHGKKASIMSKLSRSGWKKDDKVDSVKAEKTTVKPTPTKSTDVPKGRKRSLSTAERADIFNTRLNKSGVCI